jgi:anti-sigma factor RsiW
MQCRDARELVSAFIDGEVASERERSVATHLASCRECSALAEDYRKIGRQLSASYEPAPPGVAAKIRARFAVEEATPSIPDRHVRRPEWSSWMRHAAVLLLACGLSAVGTWPAIQSLEQRADLEREVVAAHVRSLLQESTTQIASSDRHTVKPWFAGRLDFAPAVKDTTAAGFPMAGGRLDLIHDRRVAAVVYKRRQHVINVFMWPAEGAEDAGPRLNALKGYNALAWTAGGINYWAVSDLNAAELGALQKLLSAS